MIEIARAAAWQTRLLEQLVNGNGLSRDDAALATGRLDQLAILLEQSPISITKRGTKTSRRLLAVRASLVLNVEILLQSGELIQDADQLFRVPKVMRSTPEWFDLDSAISQFCPLVIHRQLQECEKHFAHAGGKLESKKAHVALRYLSPQEQDRYQSDWQDLWSEQSVILRPSEILIFVLKHARDAMYQVAADAVGRMLRNGEISARSLGSMDTLNGWQAWPVAEWRRHRIIIVSTDDLPIFQAVSNDGTVQIPADYMQIGIPLPPAEVTTAKANKGGAPVKVRWGEAAAVLVAWIRQNGEPFMRGDQSAAVKHILDAFPNGGGPSKSELEGMVSTASKRLKADALPTKPTRHKS